MKGIKQNLILIFMILGITASCLLSCSSDNDGDIPTNDQNKPDSPEDNLPEESKVFVGYWSDQSTTTKAVDFLFFSDGTGRMYNDYNSTMVEGYWTFNANTAILATTMNNWQFQVTLSNNEAWSGLSLGSTTAKTYKRGEKRKMVELLLKRSSWETADLTLKIPEGNSEYMSGSILPELPNGGFNISYLGYLPLSLSEDDNTEDYTFKYDLYVEYYRHNSNPMEGKGHHSSKLGSGTITIENPYSPSKTRIIFTGKLNGTMDKVVE